MAESPVDPLHRAALESERAVNERYLRMLDVLIDRQRKIAQAAATSRNRQWTSPMEHSRQSGPHAIVGPLVGRVALAGTDPLLGSGFYIGSWHQELDDTQVVSWAAPVASLFYQGHDAADSLAGSVEGRRTFVVERNDIRDYADDFETSAKGTPSPFDAPRDKPLSIPRAPATALPQRTPAATHTPGPPSTERTPLPDPDPAHSWPPNRPAAGQPVDAEAVAVESGPVDHGLRAEQALRAALERPRTGHLASVLSTLQPDQYQLVTWPSDRPLIVQGHPGTGKTIVAAHRAAYLVHPERMPAPEGPVALIGPTDLYVDHVSQAIRDLDSSPMADPKDPRGDRSVSVLSLPALLADLAGLGPRTLPAGGEPERLDTDWRLARFLNRAVVSLRARGRLKAGGGSGVPKLINVLVKGDEALRPLFSEEPELAEWIAGVRSFNRAVESQRYLPFLAAAGMALRPPGSFRRYAHLICDEAQDIRPLEWKILIGHLHDDQRVSLFGDINQRRSDWSPESWQQLAVDREWTDDDGAFDHQVLQTGFRTTSQILRFANQLLPSGERSVSTIRSGEEPDVLRFPNNDAVFDSSIRQAERLITRFDPGTVAIISVTPRPISNLLRRTGWTSVQGRRDAWIRKGKTLMVISPEQARGLEFDGVVVVEPGAFPKNLGRYGPLFTSLTRAVHELTVVHCMPLPKGLRPPTP